MTKARDLADLISAGNPLADGAISVSEISDLTATAAEINQLDGTADLPDIRPSLLLDFANSKTLDPRITFTRGSTATYWDGKTTAKAEENLYPYSQEVNSWPKGNGVTVTADAGTAPDGTTTADRLYAPSGWYKATSFSLIAGETYTMSIYLKSNSGSNEQLVLFSENNVPSSTLTVTTSWQRFTYTFTVSSSASSDYGLWSSNPSLGGVDVLAWGMQLEQRSSATAYTATTTSPIVKYQPVLQTAASGEARFDHDPVTGESKGLLIEEARTNLATYSEDFDQWTAPVAPTAAVVTDDTIVSPDGNITGAKVDFTASDNHPVFINATISLANGADMTNSLFVKYGGGNLTSYKLQTFSQGTSNLDGYAVITFNSSGVITSVTTETNVTSVGYEDVGNGWYRVHAVQNNTTGGTQTTMRLSIGRGASDTGFIYVWGGQVEAGSFPTSYIPTSGSTVTRVRDDVDVTGANFSQWFNPTEGTILTDFDYNYNESGTGYPRIWSITEDGNIQNRMGVLINETANGLTQELYSFNSGQVSIAYQLSSLTGSATAKSSFAYAEDNFGVSANGSLGTDTSGTLATSSPRTKLRIGGLTTGGGDHRQAWIKKWAFYPKRLPNATLQAMTEA